MSADSSVFNPKSSEELRELHRCWGWLLLLGIALIVVGLAALGSPAVATIATVEIFGYLLLIGGVIEVCSSVWARRSGGFLQHLLSGLLYLFLGAIIVERPGMGAAGYTLVLAVFFVAAGLFRLVFAIGHQFEGRTWTLLSGVVALLLGVMIWRNLPEAAFWVIGTFVGIELFFNGLTWVMLAFAVRRFTSPATTGEMPPNRLVGV